MPRCLKKARDPHLPERRPKNPVREHRHSRLVVIDLTGSDSDVDVGNVAPPPMPVDNVDQFNETICPVHSQNLKTMQAYFEGP
jgi:hypothetical protein